MSRDVDAVQILNDINKLRRPTPVSQFESGVNDGLNQAMWVITHAPTLTPPNEPLMPDELKEMGGKPVWTVGVSYTDDGKWAMWDIVEKADDEGVDFGYSTESREWWNYNLRDKDGKLLNCAWVCYRRPPEGENA